MVISRFLLFPRLRLRISVLAIPTAVLLLKTEGGYPFFIMLLSALAHELGHIFALKHFGYRVRRVDVLPFGAVIAVPEGLPYYCELVIALAGPAVSLLSALLGALLFAVTKTPYAMYFLLINAVLGIFNLLPISKLDGGKAVASYLALKNHPSAQKLCRCISLCAQAIFVTLCALLTLASDLNLGVLLLSVSLILQVI